MKNKDQVENMLLRSLSKGFPFVKQVKIEMIEGAYDVKLGIDPDVFADVVGGELDDELRPFINHGATFGYLRQILKDSSFYEDYENEFEKLVKTLFSQFIPRGEEFWLWITYFVF